MLTDLDESLGSRGMKKVNVAGPGHANQSGYVQFARNINSVLGCITETSAKTKYSHVAIATL